MSASAAPKAPPSMKVFVQTWGCQMNEYDSSKMVDVLARAEGTVRTTTPEDADILLLNTCSVREKAQEKVFSDLGRFRELKQARPGLIIGVGGCVASQEGAAIRARAPYVDVIFGPQTLHRLPEMLRELRRTGKPQIDISFPEIEKFDHLPPPRKEGPTALVSVMEGCSKYCTFCVVPYTRGEEVSRPFADVLREVMQQEEQGVREITLLGQNVNAYRGQLPRGGKADLALLIQVIAQLDGIQRIRFTTSHPLEFDDRLIDTYAQQPKLANHLHLPVQSGSDRVLGMMKRGHTRADYLAKLAKLRAARPDISLSSDFIVGFPGESEEDFAATMDLIERVRFDHAYSFLYSPRPGTPAAKLVDRIPLSEKERRLALVQARVQEFGREYAQKLVGTVQPVLVERHARKNVAELAGRTGCNRVVNFPGPEKLVGQFVDVLITEVRPNSLRGRLDLPEQQAA
ncbi:MAG: tRNA (N6-isopentenyl adenosine(37)-C2)-methylthiotransferase MiaB [Nevskiales bacterium]